MKGYYTVLYRQDAADGSIFTVEDHTPDDHETIRDVIAKRYRSDWSDTGETVYDGSSFLQARRIVIDRCRQIEQQSETERRLANAAWGRF